jgi:predicted nucleic acid-binding protein
MIIVSDTSPLCYLAELGHLDLLPRLYGLVHCPPEVLAECLHEKAPLRLRQWAESPPEWLIIMGHSAWDEPLLAEIDPGEAAAMKLYQDLHADYLLVDDLRARLVAHELGIQVKGLIGILADATLSGLVEFEDVIADLKKLTSFHISESVLNKVRAMLKKQPPADHA